MNIRNIREFVEKNPGLVSRRESITYPGLFVLKYKKKVFFDNLWTEELMETRGMVVDKNWNIVVHPFTKIFNHHENGTDIPRDEEVIATRKVNGFLGCVTQYQGKNLVSTTGSLDSDFVKLASKYIQDVRTIPDHTYMFEICDPLDPHIIPEEPGAYLIGLRDNRTGQMFSEYYLDGVAEELNLLRPEFFRGRFSEVVAKSKIVKHEGFVVYGKRTTLKIKSPYYLTSKFFARKNMDKLATLISNPSSLKQTLDEEYYPLIDHLALNKEKFVSLDEQSRLDFIRNFLVG